MLYGEEHRACPKPQAPPWWGMAWRDFLLYEKGLLREAGGTLDQPNWWLELMTWIDGCLGEARADVKRLQEGG